MKMVVGFMILAIAIGFLICSFGLQKGVEKVTKVMMLALLGIIIILAIRSMTLPGAGAGLKYYLVPDFGKMKETGISPLKSSSATALLATVLMTSFHGSIVILAVLLGSIGMKLWMSLFCKTLGKEIGSKALEATATDSRNDVISTVAVLGSLLISHFLRWNIDGYIGMAVALFIVAIRTTPGHLFLMNAVQGDEEKEAKVVALEL